jgi:RNA polymerase sigma-70 factor (ECF subfamily)
MLDERPWHRVVWRASDREATARREAFTALHTEHASGVFNLALRLLGNREDAQDVSQDVLLKAYEKLADPGDLKQRAWLYRVTVNACYDRLRARKRTPAVPWDPELELDLPPTLDHCELAELRGHIAEAFRCVPPAQRAALLLREVHGLHTAEVADALGVKTASAEVTLVRARTSFRRHFLEISGRDDSAQSETLDERSVLASGPCVGGLAAIVGLPVFALHSAALPAALGASALLAKAPVPVGLAGGAVAGVLGKISAALSTKAALVAIGATVVASTAGGVYTAEHTHDLKRHRSAPLPGATGLAYHASRATAGQPHHVASPATHSAPGGAAPQAVARSTATPAPSASPLVVGESGGSPSASAAPTASATPTTTPSPSPTSSVSPTPTASASPSPTPSSSSSLPAPSPSPSL